MSTVIHNHVELRGHARDLAPLIKGGGGEIVGGVVGHGWDSSVRGECEEWKTVEFFSKLTPLTHDVAGLSLRHPRVLIQWSYSHAEGAAEGIVVASGGTIHAAGWWDDPHCDGDDCDTVYFPEDDLAGDEQGGNQ